MPSNSHREREKLNGPVTMQVRSVAKNELLLEAPERDFPHTASYTRDGEVDLRQDTHFAPIYMRRIAARPPEMADAVA